MMSTLDQPNPLQQSTDSLSASDLTELMASFNEVTARLENTHTQLRSEVGRLTNELSQANEALQRSKRLAALGEMAAGISHEIRNPLGSIRLYAKMLEEDLVELPEQQGVAEKIARAVRGLDGIVSDVLTFAKELRVHKARCLLSDVIDVSVEACQAQLIGISVSKPAQDFTICCDCGLVQQAMVNILRNAAEANRSVGTCGIDIEIEAGDVLEEESVVIRVRDQGDGMPAEVIERMFNPFFTTRATGTGLGLAIVHRMMDAHDGQVVVFNNSNEANAEHGATVELHLPVGNANEDTQSGGAGEIVIKARSGQMMRA
jgi:signal transduction histidine kinase